MLNVENNKVHVVGTIVSVFRFSHKVCGEGFYLTDISIERLSGICDNIPLMVSDRLIDVTQDYSGQMIEVSGQFRSYSEHTESGNKLLLSVFVREWSLFEEEPHSSKANQIYLEGFICRAPSYRVTPLGREIADLLVAVNRPYGKSDYIPCISWGRNARFVSTLDVGTELKIWGRVQSREYIKKFEDETQEVRTAYEVSVNKIEKINE